MEAIAYVESVTTPWRVANPLTWGSFRRDSELLEVSDSVTVSLHQIISVFLARHQPKREAYR